MSDVKYATNCYGHKCRYRKQIVMNTALRKLVEMLGLPSDSICYLEAEPGKLDIKRCETCILFISAQAGSLFKPAIMT